MEKSFFSIGDVAKLYKISKQTLFYYERLGLLVPQKQSNGYRVYTVTDCERLEMIISLKKLNLSLQEIQEYFQAPSEKRLEHLYSRARSVFEVQLDTLYDNKLKLENAIYDLKKSQEIILGQILLEMCEEAHYYTTMYEGLGDSLEEIKQNLIYHKQKLLESDSFYPLYSGLCLNVNEQASSRYRITKCCTKLGFGIVMKDMYRRPRGLYMSVYLQGSILETINQAMHMMNDFMKKNELLGTGDIIVEPISNYWTEASVESYIYKFSLPVR